MKIKLALNGGLGYFFAGPVALSVKNNIKNPLTVDADTLSDKDVLSLARASKSGTIKIVEGEKEFLEKAYQIAGEAKSKKIAKALGQPEVVAVVAPVEEVKAVEPEVIVEVKEEVPAPVVEEEKPVENAEPVAEEVVEKKTTTRAKRTTTKK